MTHLKNIEKLFSKNFVESPLIDTYEAGNLMLTSGKLVACDPLTTTGMPSFTTQFPQGAFPVLVHVEKESNCVAYVEIVFKEAEAHSWEMALTAEQNLEDLGAEEIFGYPVESGMGCFMDEETEDSLHFLEQKIYAEKGEQFSGLYDEFFRPFFFESDGAVNQYSFLQPDPEKDGTIFAFETGYGEGFYASYICFDESHQPIKIISEFIEIES